MSSKRHYILLFVAVLFAYAAISGYFSIKSIGEVKVESPADFAPDVFTSWTIDYSDSTNVKMVFEGKDDLGMTLKVVHNTRVDAQVLPGFEFREWRGGLLIGDSKSLAAWVEMPGEMALRWRSEEGVNARLYKTPKGYILEKAKGDLVVWEEELRIPKFILDRGGYEFTEDESDLALKYDAVVEALDGKFMASDLGDRFTWVFVGAGSTEVLENHKVSNQSEQSSELRGLLGVIRNHRTSSDMDILFNEDDSVVEAWGEDGELVWSREVEAAPIGEAFEVDIYANGKFQTAFATSKGVYLIDVKGNNVSGYPYKMRSGVTGFSVVDYDRNKKYRFLVATADGNITNLKGEGKRTSGWNFAKLSGGVYVKHLYHLRVGSKDYIYAGCSDSSVKLLKRAGGIRANTEVKVDSRYSPAFRLSSNISKSSVLFIDDTNTLREFTMGEAREVGMSGLVKADRVEVLDVNSDGKKEVVVYYDGKRTIWNSRNEKLD